MYLVPAEAVLNAREGGVQGQIGRLILSESSGNETSLLFMDHFLCGYFKCIVLVTPHLSPVKLVLLQYPFYGWGKQKSRKVE